MTLPPRCCYGHQMEYGINRFFDKMFVYDNRRSKKEQK